MVGLTNEYVEKLCKKIIKKNFLGVFPSDVLPQTKKEFFSVIFNLSRHDERGSHFIAIIKKKNNIIYFDSYGMDCYVDSINQFLHKFNVPISWNKKKIQDDFSNFCGFFCFYFIFCCFLKNIPLKDFTNQFTSNNLKENDTKLINFIIKKIKNKLF